MISPLAYVHPDAKLGNNVTVEPFAYIAGDVEIGDDCWIGPGAVIHDGARIGKRNKIHTAASISCLPQDLKFVGEKTTAVIGDDNDIRECVTISRGTASRGTTVVGNGNLLMAYVHVLPSIFFIRYSHPPLRYSLSNNTNIHILIFHAYRAPSPVSTTFIVRKIIFKSIRQQERSI